MKEFKVMSYQHEGKYVYPDPIPFSLVEKHEKQCMKNHYQTPEQLNRRGGCCPVEFWFILNDLDSDWGQIMNMSELEKHNWLKEFVNNCVE